MRHLQTELLYHNQVITVLSTLFFVIILAATIPAAKAAPNKACSRTQKYFAINIFVLSCKHMENVSSKYLFD